MATTIQISQDLQKELAKLKLSSRDTYEGVIWDLVEDRKELSEQTKRDITKARKEVAAGKYITHEELKKQLGL